MALNTISVQLYTKLEDLSTQFFMIQIMWHLLLAPVRVCMLRLWESRNTQIRDACRLCMPASVCMWMFRQTMHDGRISIQYYTDYITEVLIYPKKKKR